MIKSLVDSIFKQLKEESSTGTGSSFTPGEGEQYATKLAFKPKYRYKLAPKINENESNDESYIDSLKIDDPELKEFVKKRILGFDQIEQKLNELLPLLKKAKLETMEYYKKNPNYDVIWSTDLTNEYLDDILKMFKK